MPISSSSRQAIVLDHDATTLEHLSAPPSSSTDVAPTPPISKPTTEALAARPSRAKRLLHALGTRGRGGGRAVDGVDMQQETVSGNQSPPNGLEATPALSPRTRTKRILQHLRTFAIDQWFLLALSLLILIASQIQVPLPHQQLKETLVTYIAVSIIFFITGCTLPTSVLIANYTRLKLHLFVQIQCFLMTSATTFAIVSIAATNRHFMDPWLLIGLLMTGCVPTTISSNVVMTRQAGGNTALTVVQSTIGNFLGPFLTPVLLRMYTGTGAWYTLVLPATSGGYGEVYARVFKQLGLSLFLPLVVGQVVQNVWPNATRRVMADWRGSKLGSFGLLAMIWQTFDSAFATGAFGSVPGRDMVFIVFISLAFYAIWLGIAFGTSMLWLPRKDVISVCYCVPAKTPAIGVPLTTVLFVGIALIDQSKIQIPMVIFQGFQIFQGSLLTIVFRRWIKAEEEGAQDAEKIIPLAEVEAGKEAEEAEKGYKREPRGADNA